MLNRLVKTVRNDHMDLLGFPEWDGDPNQRFNDRDSIRWLRRFDDDSDWPSVEQRQPSVPTAAPPVIAAPEELRAKAGEPCPATGVWEWVDSNPQRRRYAYSEPMGNLGSAYGWRIWRYVSE